MIHTQARRGAVTILVALCTLFGATQTLAAGKSADVPAAASSASTPALRFAVELEPEYAGQNKTWPTIGYSAALTKQLGKPVKVVNSVLLREVARGSLAGSGNTPRELKTTASRNAKGNIGSACSAVLRIALAGGCTPAASSCCC